MKDIVNWHNWTASQSIAFTKFGMVQLLLAVKIRMTACSKEKRLFLNQVQTCAISFSASEVVNTENRLRLF